MITAPDQDRFWRAVAVGPADVCWEWQLYRQPSGHGRFRHKGQTRSAHRVSWEIANGQIGAGLVVRHRCDNPCCVNPSHLVLGSQAENVSDMDRRGRRVTVTGPAHSARKAKTHCKRGHSLSGSNLRISNEGTRVCRACKAGRQRLYRSAA